VTNDPNCVFCGIVAGKEPATYVAELPGSIVIVPHHPVVKGHVLVIPRVHVRDATERPEVTGATFADAASIAAALGSDLPSLNLITSVGRPATQTVFHLHVHIVPRAEGDGLTLPWTGQVKE
jgi:histidine triad (HIT) family protein